MKWKNVMQLSDNVAIVEKDKNNKWVYCKHPDYKIKSKFTTKKQIIAEARRDEVSLVVEAQNDWRDYSIFHSDLTRDYLQGMSFGAIIIDDVNYDFSSDDDDIKIYNSSERLLVNLEQELEILGIKYNPATDRNNNKLKEALGFSPQAVSKSSDCFSLNELEALSARIGVIVPAEDGAEYTYCKKSPRNKKPDWYFATEKIDALTELSAAGCDLIVEKISEQKYKIAYCDTYKNQARGLFEAFLVVDYHQKSGLTFDGNKMVQVENMLRSAVNRARKEARLERLPKNEELRHAEKNDGNFAKARN